MATYKSEKTTLNASAERVYDKLSNFENLKGLLEKVPLDQVPEDKRGMLESITITPDAITVPGGPVGSLSFRVVEKNEPTLIRLAGEGSPMPLYLVMHITPESADSCQAMVEVDIDLPAMLKPMVGGYIQKMADQFGQVLKAIPF